MKFWKKLLCLVLSAALVMVLYGCSAFTPRMVLGMQKMAKLQSLHSETAITADVTLSLLEQETPVTVEIQVVGDHQREGALNAFDVKLSLMDIEQHVLLYTKKDAGALTVYTSWDNGEFWAKSTLKQEENEAPAAPSDSGDLLKLALGLSQYFEESGPVLLPGADGKEREAIGYEGVIPAEMVQEILRSSGLTEKLGEDAPVVLDEAHLALVGELPVKVVLDKQDNMVVRVELDLTGVLGGLLQQLLQDVLAKYDLEGSVVGLTIDSIHTVTDLSGFDSVTVTLPEVKGA